MGARLSHVIGIDDAPFERAHRGDVPLVGAVYSELRLDGVVTGRARRDGANATRRITEMILRSRFAPQLHAVLLQGIAVAGFNVVDIHALAAAAGLPVVVVARRRPNMKAIRRALLQHVRGGARKWRLIEAAGPMQSACGIYVQCAGISLQRAARLIDRLAVHGRIPEPVRAAHLIATAWVRGESHGRP